MVKIKRILSVSIIINIVLLCATGALFCKSGYLGSILNRFAGNTSVYRYLDNTQYIDRTSLFDRYKTAADSVVFIGDSIVQRCDFGELFGVENICNRGVGSDTTEGVLNRLDGIISMNPSKIFLMIGINDIAFGVGSEALGNNYGAILDRLSKELPDADVYVLSILPTRKAYAGIPETNSSISKMAIEHGYQYANLYNLMVDENDALLADLTSDGVHLNGAGYAIMRDALSEFVTQ